MKNDLEKYLQGKYGKEIPHYDDGTDSVGGFDVDAGTDASTVKTPSLPNGQSFINAPSLPTANVVQSELQNPITQGNGNPQGGPTPNQMLATIAAAKALPNKGQAKAPAPTTSTPDNATQDTMQEGANVLGEFTPENRMALYQQLLQKQNSLPNAIGSGLSALGDALGAVAGGGRPTTNFAERNQANNAEARQEGNALMSQGAQEKGEQFKLGTTAEEQDPHSAVSKQVAQVAENITGLKGQLVDHVPASFLNPIMSTAKDMSTARANIIMAYAQMKQQYNLGMANIGETRAGRATTALQDAAKMGPIDRNLLHPEEYKELNQIAQTGEIGENGNSQPLGTVNYNGISVPYYQH